MPLKPLTFREVKRRLEAAGFFEGGAKGSHVKFVKKVEGGTVTAVVPRHREVTVGILRSGIKQAGITPEDFEKL